MRVPSTFARRIGTAAMAASVMTAVCAVSGFAGSRVQNPAPAAVAAAPKTMAPPMRLTSTSEHAKELFGQAILLSGNYRLDECLKSLRTATTEDGNFAAGWALLSYYATDAHEAADALARAQALAGKTSASETLFVR